MYLLTVGSLSIAPEKDQCFCIVDQYSRSMSSFLNEQSSPQEHRHSTPNQRIIESQGFQLMDSDNTNGKFSLIVTNNFDFVKVIQQCNQRSNLNMSGYENVTNNHAQRHEFDQEFIDQLQQLINGYLDQTRRPFPIKMMIDLS